MIEHILKEVMTVNTIYEYIDEENCYNSKALAENGLIYALRSEKPTWELTTSFVMNSLYDIQQGGDGAGSSNKPRPADVLYPIVCL